MRDDIWYREELKVLHDLVLQETKTGYAGRDAAQSAALWHLGQKLIRAMETAPSAAAPAGAA